jgi:hypothetical protein
MPCEPQHACGAEVDRHGAASRLLCRLLLRPHELCDDVLRRQTQRFACAPVQDDTSVQG